MLGNRTVVVVLALVLLLVALAGCGLQPGTPDYPTKNIDLIVPFTPGGGFDLQARMIAPYLAKYLPKQVNIVVQNVSGAGGRLGVSQLSKSKADGYTVGVVGLESVAFMYSLGQLDDDPGKWSFFGQISSDPLLVAVNANSGLSTAASMKGKDFRFGITSEMLPSAAVITKLVGANYRPVLFNGSGDAILAGNRGDVDALVFSWPSMLKGINDSGGKLKPAFVVNKTRLDAVKDVQTLEEQGVKPDDAAYSVVATSRIFVGPAGMDKAIVDLLTTAINKSTSDPEFVAQMKKGQYEITTAQPSDLNTRMQNAVTEFKSVKSMVESYVK
jgi:tripartite-type tricarboxylate transporter receptor subunit TctC